MSKDAICDEDSCEITLADGSWVQICGNMEPYGDCSSSPSYKYMSTVLYIDIDGKNKGKIEME